jgi:hypothetical protein
LVKTNILTKLQVKHGTLAEGEGSVHLTCFY